MLVIGLMSGTSTDGIDGVLAEIDDAGHLTVLAHDSRAMPDTLRQSLLSLNTPGDDELHRAAVAANALARLQAEVVTSLQARRPPGTVVQALSSHGQTVRHRPDLPDGDAYTVQLNNPALLAELTGLDVVSDLRSRDIAAGGQGAPLVPAFHARSFGAADEDRAVLNIGGIANFSLLPAGPAMHRVLGFDCGPGNVLLDLWAQRHLGQPCDLGGLWAAQGRVHEPLLQRLLDEPYLALPLPKSTGRDLFHAEWLAQRLPAAGDVAAVDVQRTLTAFTAATAAEALHRHMPTAQRLLVCGGGVYNDTLMAELRARWAGTVQSTADHGLPPLQVEAAAFAWLGWAFMQREPGNLPAVTGARGPRVLGSLTPA